MRIIVCGGTGFIGSALSTALQNRGDEVWIVTRQLPAAPAAGFLYVTWEEWSENPNRLGGFDAIVCLAGETVGQRWTEEAKRRILVSRTQTALAIEDIVRRMDDPPRTLVNASGISLYGHSYSPIPKARKRKRSEPSRELLTEDRSGAVTADIAGIRGFTAKGPEPMPEAGFDERPEEYGSDGSELPGNAEVRGDWRREDSFESISSEGAYDARKRNDRERDTDAREWDRDDRGREPYGREWDRDDSGRKPYGREWDRDDRGLDWEDRERDPYGREWERDNLERDPSGHEWGRDDHGNDTGTDNGPFAGAGRAKSGPFRERDSGQADSDMAELLRSLRASAGYGPDEEDRRNFGSRPASAAGDPDSEDRIGPRTSAPLDPYAGSGWFGEDSPARPEDFLGNVIIAWEEAVDRIPIERIVKLRISMVLARKGGSFHLLRLPYRLFVGGRMGSGTQGLPWIHIDDMVSLILFCLDRKDISGPVNAVAPDPVNNDQFGRTLAKVTRRPHWFHAPAGLIRRVLGEQSTLLLTGQHAYPRKALERGFEFAFPRLEDALRDLTR